MFAQVFLACFHRGSKLLYLEGFNKYTQVSLWGHISIYSMDMDLVSWICRVTTVDGYRDPSQSYVYSAMPGSHLGRRKSRLLHSHVKFGGWDSSDIFQLTEYRDSITNVLRSAKY